MSADKRAIGIFDSGVGGLTVLKEIERLLPYESIIYFGDTARVPYGPKSRETIERYTLENTIFLLEKNIKLLVVACNTASAYGIEKLKRIFAVPIVEVIMPGAENLVFTTKNKKAAILATKATVASEAYPKAIHALDPHIEVLSIACPLLTPMIEEQMIDHPALQLMLREYLKPVKERECDTILLGCTHYPLIERIIAKEMDHKVHIVNSASLCALKTAELLEFFNLKNGRKGTPNVQFYVSDDPLKFQEMGQRFLERPIANVTRIPLRSLC